MTLKKVTRNYDSSNPYKGIIDYITTQTGSSNVNKDGYLKAQFSSFVKGNEFAPIGIDFIEGNTYWESNNQLNEWYSIDFVDSCVRMKSFVMSNYGRDYPKLLSVEGSNDGISWQTIEEKEIDDYGYSTYVKQNFDISNNLTTRMIRFRNKLERHLGDKVIVIYRLEIFGDFIPKCSNYERNKCITRSTMSFSSLPIIASLFLMK